MDHSVDFCTLGMIVIDEIHFPAPRPSVYNVLGGAGCYSALGARLFSPPPQSKSVAWIVDAGSDFPDKIRKEIQSWNTDCCIRETPERLTTRGWNSYRPSGYRDFRYSTPKIRLDHNSLTASYSLAKSFHLICGPARCIELVTGITSLRDKINSDSRRPLFIWEPTPDLCNPELLDDCLKASVYVDIVSPNHLELGNLFNRGATHASDGEVDEVLVEELSNNFLISGARLGGTASVVVRCGNRGCFIAHPDIPIQDRWLPAFHAPSTAGEENSSVVDPTGGGNAFLGGLSIGMVRVVSMTGGDKLREASIWGTVAASFAIEQIGVPLLGEDEQGETWNGVHVGERFAEYKRRIRSS